MFHKQKDVKIGKVEWLEAVGQTLGHTGHDKHDMAAAPDWSALPKVRVPACSPGHLVTKRTRNQFCTYHIAIWPAKHNGGIWSSEDTTTGTSRVTQLPNIPGMLFGVRHLAIVEVTNMGYTRLPNVRWRSQAGTSANTTQPTFTNTLRKILELSLLMGYSSTHVSNNGSPGNSWCCISMPIAFWKPGFQDPSTKKKVPISHQLQRRTYLGSKTRKTWLLLAKPNWSWRCFEKFNQGAAVSPEANMGSTARMKVQKFCFNERVGWFRFSADFSSYECERKRVHVRDLCIVPFRVLVCMSWFMHQPSYLEWWLLCPARAWKLDMGV